MKKSLLALTGVFASIALFSQLNGTYTINSGGGANYTSYTAAINALTAQGVSGPVTFNVTGGGPYNEQLTIPAITGASAANTITFNGNATTLTYSPTGSPHQAVVFLNGADYVTLNNIVINATGSTYSVGVRFGNQADYNTVSNCTINVDPSYIYTSTSVVPIAFTSSNTSYSGSGNHGNYNTIINNQLISGYWGVSFYNASSTANTQNVGNQIIGNIIRDFYYGAMYLYAYAHNWTVRGNDMYRSTRTSMTSTYFIYIYGYPTSSGASTTGAFVIEKNRFRRPQGGLASSPYVSYGIYANYIGGGNAGVSTIRNNAFYDWITSSTQIGMYMYYSQGYDIFHNTLNLGAGTSTQYGIYVFYPNYYPAVYGYATSPTVVRNNINRNSSTAGTKYLYYIQLYSTSYPVTVNTNDLWMVAGGTNYFGYHSSYGTATSFAQWQGFGMDVPGYNLDPAFNNPAAGDLMPTNASLNNLGANLGVTDDILSNTRNPSTPDIGAWEFSSSPDFGVFQILQPSSGCILSATTTVQVQVKNFSTIPGAPTSVTFQVTGPNNTGPVTEAWTGGVIPGLGTANMTFVATANLSSLGTYTVTANTTLAGDTDASNNSKTKIVVRTGPVTANAGPDVTVCPGGPKTLGGSPTGSGGNGGPYTYLWAPSTGLSSTTAANPVCSQPGPGPITYTVTVTDGNGCNASDQVTVSWSPAPTVNAGPDWEYCENSGTVVNLGGSPTSTGGSPPYSYNWQPNASLSPNNTVSNPDANPNVTTNYTVFVTDNVGCTVSDAALVTVNQLPDVTILIQEGRDSACYNEVVCLQAMVAGCGVWTGGFGGSYYQPANWTLTNVPGSVGGSIDVTNAPASVKLTGGNAGVGGYTYWGIAAPCAGVMHIDWSWTTNDSPFWDRFGYRINGGPFVEITSQSGGNNQSGTLNVPVSAGTFFEYAAYTVDGVAGAGVTTLSNFTGPIFLIPANDMGYSVVWNTGWATDSLCVTPPAGTNTFQAWVTDLNGCVGTNSMDIWVNDEIVLDNPDVAVCYGFSGNLGGAPTASGGMGGFVYDWQVQSNYLSCWDCPNPVSSSPFTTTYTLTVTDSFLCVVTDVTNYTVNPLPQADAGSPQAICPGFTTTIGGSPTGFSGTAPYTYSWSPSTGLNDPTLANPDASPAVTTQYTVLVTDANGCTATDNMQVTVYPEPDASILTTGPYCDNAGVQQLQAATPGGTWSASCGACITPSGQFDPATAGAGVHMVTYDVTNAVGCSDSDTEPITVNAHPTPVITSNTDFCSNGAPANLTAVPAGGTWSGNGITNPSAGTFDPTVAGTGVHNVTYTYTDANGCSGSDVVAVTVHAAPDATINPAGPFCENAAAYQLTAATAGGTWSGPGTSPSGVFTPSAAGVGTHTITYTVTDANGCSDNDQTQITVLSSPAAGINAAGPFCVNASSVTLTATPASGTNYWSGPGIIDPLSGLFSPSAAGPGTHLITVVKTYSNGCSSTASVNITVNALPNATINSLPNNNTLCAGGAPVQLTAATPGGTWSGPGTSPSGMFNPSTAGVGTHTVTYTVTDANNCTNSDQHQITVAPAIVLTGTVSDAGCEGASDGDINVVTNGGTPPFTWLWNDGATTEDRYKIPAGTYTVTATDPLGCTGTATFTVGEPTPITITPVVVNDATTPQHSNGSIDITPAGGTPPYSFIWSTGETTEDVTSLPPDDYHVTVMDANGCRYYFDITVDAQFSVGIDLAAVSEALKVYPNPTNGLLQVELDLGIASEVFVTMQDVLGRVMYTANSTMVNSFSHTVDMSSWAAGQYILAIQVGEHVVQSKVVLTR